MALALLALVIVSSTVLFNTSTRLNTESGRRTQALALANQELEALRFYRDEQRRQNSNWATSMPPVGSGCANFVMEEVGDGNGNKRYIIKTGLIEEAGQSTLHQSYPPSQDSFSGTFRRLGTMCASREYDPLIRQYVSSDQVRTVEIELVWEEASAPIRTSKVTTIISNWDNR